MLEEIAVTVVRAVRETLRVIREVRVSQECLDLVVLAGVVVKYIITW